jgi:hypothetical protein
MEMAASSLAMKKAAASLVCNEDVRVARPVCHLLIVIR